MSTMSMLRTLKHELNSNECNALLDILDRLVASNTVYDTAGYIEKVESDNNVNVAEIKGKLQNFGTVHKVAQNRIGKDLDLL